MANAQRWTTSLTAMVSLFLGVLISSPALGASVAVHRAAEDKDRNQTSTEGRSDDSDLRLEKREEWLLRLYDRAEAALQESGYEVAIGVDQLTHILPEQFDHVHVYETESRRSGWVVKATPLTQVETSGTSDDPEELGRTTSFLVRWRKVEDWKKNDSANLIASSTLAEVIDRTSKNDHRFSNVLLVSTFRVQLDLNDRARTYRAAAYWFEGVGEGQEEKWELILRDQVLDNVERMFVASKAYEDVQSDEEIDGISEDHSELIPHGDRIDLNDGGCEPFDKTVPPLEELPVNAAIDDTREHVDGALSLHQSSLTVRFRCTCSQSCTATCTPKIETYVCDDFGTVVVGRQHAVDSQLVTSTGTDSEPGSLVSGPGCQAMLGCAVKSCESGVLCNASIDLEVSGIIVSIKSEDSTYSMSINHPLKSCPPCEEVSDPASPIVIDVLGDSLHFTGLEEPVSFDIEGDGEPERLSWTFESADDAFLALDRNGNGRIDDGLELFGNHTAQPAHPDPNGFLALAVFDQPLQGGNGDGWITVADDIFRALRLWQDRNRDGVSQPEELQALGVHGVDAIELDYIEAKRRDAPGNQLRWASKVRFGDALRLSAVDVIFLEEK